MGCNVSYERLYFLARLRWGRRLLDVPGAYWVLASPLHDQTPFLPVYAVFSRPSGVLVWFVPLSFLARYAVACTIHNQHTHAYTNIPHVVVAHVPLSFLARCEEELQASVRMSCFVPLSIRVRSFSIYRITIGRERCCHTSNCK